VETQPAASLFFCRYYCCQRQSRFHAREKEATAVDVSEVPAQVRDPEPEYVALLR